MLDQQLTKRYRALIAAVARAKGRYSIARGARKDSGAWIESTREAKARRILEAARDDLSQFERAHALSIADRPTEV